MLYSIAAGFAAYWAFVALAGVLLNLKAVEATLLFFGIVCFGGAYFARNSRFVRRMCNWIGGICVAIFLVTQFALPLLQGNQSLVVSIAIIFGLVVYGATRVLTWRHYFGRRGHVRPVPPFGKEWARWVLFFVG